MKSRLGVSHPDVQMYINEYNSFQEKERTDPHSNTPEAPQGRSWGTIVAVGLLSTALFALNRLK